jgi:hypothetical protein
MPFLLQATSQRLAQGILHLLLLPQINVKEIWNAQKLTAHKYFIWNYVPNQ